LSCASSSHGDTFPSWSSFVTTISSPAFQSRAAVRESAKFSVVMFAPKIVSSGAQRRKSAAVRRDCETSASVRRLVSYGPLTLALESR